MLNFINIAQAHMGEVGMGYDSSHNFGMAGGAWSFFGIIMWLAVFSLMILGIIALFKYVFRNKRIISNSEYCICSEYGFKYKNNE